MSEDTASSSEQNNSSNQTTASNLRLSKKICCREQTNSHVYLSLMTKAAHVHEIFKQYRKKVKSKKSPTISPVPVKSASF